MSDDYLRLVPADPTWQPSEETAQRCAELLRSFYPSADEISAEFPGAIAFFDSGSNLGNIYCPACGQSVQAWWPDAMDRAYETAFQNLAVRTPCCGAETSLNDLRYDWPSAFGRFALEIRNPGLPTVPGEQRHAALEDCLGTSLRIVWCHL